MVNFTCPEDILLSTSVRNKFGRGALASLKSSVMAFLCGPDLTVGTLVTELGNVNALGVIGFQGDQGQGVALHSQRPGGCDYCQGRQGQSSNWSGLTCAAVCHWLVDHGAPRSKIDRKPSKFLPICMSRKVRDQVNRNVTLIIKTSHDPSISSQT